MPGSSVKVVGPPLKLVATFPLTLHASVNQEEVTLTGSLNVIVRLALIGKSVAPLSGKVSETSGGKSIFLGVRENVSTARPSSAPGDISKSVQRIQNEAPLGILKPVIEKLTEVWFPDALPFNAPRVTLMFELL